MLGQPISMLIPPVLGFRLIGSMLEGATATDLVLTITERLRKHGVVGKFVEFFGPGLAHPDHRRPRHARQHVSRIRRHHRHLPDRRDDARLSASERPRRGARGARRGLRQGAGAVPRTPAIRIRSTAKSSSSIWPPSSRASPAPGGRRTAFRSSRRRAASRPACRRCVGGAKKAAAASRRRRRRPWRSLPAVGALEHGSVVIAAITSCTNTSNPSVMIGAGLVAKKAVERGLVRQPWVKTSLAPGSKVVTEYLAQGRPQHVPRSARLQSGGLRLHDLHRQQRPAARGRRRGSGIAEPGRRLGPQRQPQLRRTHPAAGARELPGVAAAGRRVCAGGSHDASI